MGAVANALHSGAALCSPAVHEDGSRMFEDALSCVFAREEPVAETDRWSGAV